MPRWFSRTKSAKKRSHEGEGIYDNVSGSNIDFSNLKTVILDEADQMLKQGFKEEIDKVSDFWSTRIYIFSLLTFGLFFHIDPS